MPRSFFVFATRPVSQRDGLASKPGEPLLVLRPFADDVVVLSSDGECYRTVSARCDLPAFRRYRDGLAAKARADLGETRQRWRREVIKHLVELGFAEAATP